MRMKIIFLPFVFLLMSCSLGTDGDSVMVQNKTDVPVIICDFSPLKNETVFPVEVAAGEEYVFETGCMPEEYQFTVEIDGKRYKSETRYVQDWWRFSIVFTGTAKGGVECMIDKNERKLRLSEEN